MKRKPTKPPTRDFFVSTDEFAECVGRDGSRIRQLTSEGILTRDSTGRYDLRKAVKEYVGYLDDKNRLHQLKIEKMEHENRLVRIAVQKAEVEVISMEAAKKAWGEIILTFRQRILRVANKVAPRLPFCKSESDMEKEIDLEVREALMELSKTPLFEGDDAE